MKLTFYGHACFSIQLGDTTLLFDPFISPNELAKHIDLDSIKADYILLSHGHEDHVADVEVIAKRTGATIISNFEVTQWFGNKGVEKGHPMNHGGSWSLYVPDPEGNTIELFVKTTWYVPPHATTGLDLSQSEEQIHQQTALMAKQTPGSKPWEVWRKEFQAQMHRGR